MTRISIEEIGQAAFICNGEGQFIEVNTLFCLMVGCGKEVVMKKNIFDFHFNKYAPALFKKLNFNALSEMETEIKTCDGKIIPCILKTSPVNKGQKRLTLGIVWDISLFRQKEEKLLANIINSEEKERSRVAAQLHDDLSPILSTIKLYTGLIKDKCSADEKTQNIIKNIEKLTDLAIKTSKEISYNITPSILHDFGLAAAIKKFAQFVNDTKSFRIEVKTDKYTLENRTMAESILYQAAKELINNTIKHSGATEATLELSNTENMILMYYKDNGHGFDMEKALENGQGLGLRNIQNKVQTIHGTCNIYSEEGKGMIATITVPLNTTDTTTYKHQNSCDYELD